MLSKMGLGKSEILFYFCRVLYMWGNCLESRNVDILTFKGRGTRVLNIQCNT